MASIHFSLAPCSRSPLVKSHSGTNTLHQLPSYREFLTVPAFKQSASIEISILAWGHILHSIEAVTAAYTTSTSL